MSVLSVENLSVSFRTDAGVVPAVRGVGFTVERGETLCIVGESGSGKSVTCHAVLGLVAGNGRVTEGRVMFDGRDLVRLSERELGRIRGRRIAMIFQDPVASLNPIHRIGWQLSESLMLHEGLTSRAAWARAVELLGLVGISEAERRLREYPHQLSGGMNQRVMIALAFACRPALLIADEPTTALDVTIQAQILDLMRTLQNEIGMSILFITHDLGVVAEMADRVVVMRHGQVVETGAVAQIFGAPREAYTRELLSLVPRLEAAAPVYREGVAG
jgi:ABC-type dipeptide/oligopeptide/nickel transport system ATPase component